MILKAKLNDRSKITIMNTWECAILRYATSILDWKDNGLKNLYRKTRKMMTMKVALHPISDVGRLYVKGFEGGRGLISV